MRILLSVGHVIDGLLLELHIMLVVLLLLLAVVILLVLLIVVIVIVAHLYKINKIIL